MNLKYLAVISAVSLAFIGAGCASRNVEPNQPAAVAPSLPAAEAETPPAPAVETKVVATSPDKNFVIRTYSQCPLSFGVSAGEPLTDGSMAYVGYNLGWKENAAVPEDQDAGMVKVQKATNAKTAGRLTTANLAFENSEVAVYSILTELGEYENICQIIVAAQ